MQLTRRKTTLLTIAFAAILGATAAAFTGCTALLGDYEVDPTAGEGGTGTNNGAACTTAAQCGSGFCSDGVCCESACSGTCESCAIEKGKCTAVPDGQDPDKECKATPREDAGAAPEPDAQVLDDGGVDGTAPDAATEEEGDGGGQVNLPDAGFVSADDKCAGSCNGSRACKFPKNETTCGTKFCNSPSQAGRFACDGKGRCELEISACQSFSCEGDECRKTCAEQNDCQKTHFCNPMGLCQQRLADGLGCGNPDQCRSGFCVTPVGGGQGVCCNSECDFPGSQCNKAGSVGKCKCATPCGTGSCRLFYKDSDNDGFGDKNATFPATATVGCDNAPPPATFSATKDDCDDADNRAFPGQTAYFADKTTKGSFDFNCDGNITKETREYPGSTCLVCGDPKLCPSSTSCTSRNASQSRLTCDLYSSLTICLPGTPCSPYSCGYSRFVSNTAGFTTTVDCGVTSGAYTTCGKCTGLAGAPPSSTALRQQRCR